MVLHAFYIKGFVTKTHNLALFIYGSDFDNEAWFCSLQVVHKVSAQSLNVWTRDMVIEIKVKDIGRGDACVSLKHGKQCAACPIQRLDGVACFEIFIKEVGNFHGAVGGCGNGFAFELANKSLGGENESKKKDECLKIEGHKSRDKGQRCKQNYEVNKWDVVICKKLT